MNSRRIEQIDAAMFLRPPSPRQWCVKHSSDFRFGWDPLYASRYGQKFSPWFFARNAAAVLGHVRANGQTDLMTDMASQLVDILQLHLEEQAGGLYVTNRFKFDFLSREFDSPFYGAFMNAVTAFGLMHLHEATREDRYLVLASTLLNTIADKSLPIPLMTMGGGKIWLHEYVYRTSSPAFFPSEVWGGWNCARIYNGHAHALLTFLRHDEVVKGDAFRWLIDGALRTVREEFPHQIFKGRYFSYCTEVPEQPDYGQERAYKLLEGIGTVTGDAEIASSAMIAKDLYFSKIAGREARILRHGISWVTRILKG